MPVQTVSIPLSVTGLSIGMGSASAGVASRIAAAAAGRSKREINLCAVIDTSRFFSPNSKLCHALSLPLPCGRKMFDQRRAGDLDRADDAGCGVASAHGRGNRITCIAPGPLACHAMDIGACHDFDAALRERQEDQHVRLAVCQVKSRRDEMLPRKAEHAMTFQEMRRGKSPDRRK